jgi:hypothetical protein
LTIKYLRRESFSFYPTLLSKIAITADQKALRTESSGSGTARSLTPFVGELSHPRLPRA